MSVVDVFLPRSLRVILNTHHCLCCGPRSLGRRLGVSRVERVQVSSPPLPLSYPNCLPHFPTSSPEHL